MTVLGAPGDFTAKTRGTLVDLGGECRDVATVGSTLVALIASDKGGELVILSRAKTDYTVAARHALPAAFDRILD